jgi:hypothetical protein
MFPLCSANGNRSYFLVTPVRYRSHLRRQKKWRATGSPPGLGLGQSFGALEPAVKSTATGIFWWEQKLTQMEFCGGESAESQSALSWCRRLLF